MPRRKQPLPAPTHDWIDGERTVGEIILSMAQELYEDREDLSRSPKTNQLAALAEFHIREKQFIEKVNAAFAELNAYQIRQANAGATNKRVNGDATASKVEKIFNDLRAKGSKVTASTVEKEWLNPMNQKKGFGKPVTPQSIRSYLRQLKAKAP